MMKSKATVDNRTKYAEVDLIPFSPDEENERNRTEEDGKGLLQMRVHPLQP